MPGPDRSAAPEGPGAEDYLWVFGGGTVGTGLRALLTAPVVLEGFSPAWAVWAINVSGAFALGVLLSALGRLSSSARTRRRFRLFLGTGVLGGYTTYSAFAVETMQLLGQGRFGAAATYAAASLVGGLGAAGLGVLVASRTAGKGPR